MARNLGGRPFTVLRHLVNRPPPPPPLTQTPPRPISLSKTLLPGASQHHTVPQHRLFSSSPPPPGSGLPGLTLLKSDQDFKASLDKAIDDRLPSIFYFTAAWCGPCKLMSPVIEDLSKKYNNVKIYKIDVDQKELESTLSNLKIYSVPTLHFFQNGEKASEMVGADVALLKKTMEDLYK